MILHNDTTHTKQMIKAGYVYKNEYTGRYQFNAEIGVKERQSIIGEIEKSLNLIYLEEALHTDILRRGNNLTYEIELLDQTLCVNFDTINSIVTQNKDRKIMSLPFYPYDKTMDKYNSIYVSLVTNHRTDDTVDLFEQVLGRVMTDLNLYEFKYGYKSLPIGAPIVA